MSGAAEADALWRTAHDDAAGPVRRSLARMIWRYRAAPLREMLVGPEGAYMLDGLLVAIARAAVALPCASPRPMPAEPAGSGWRGNLIFLGFWMVVLGGIAIAARMAWHGG